MKTENNKSPKPMSNEELSEYFWAQNGYNPDTRTIRTLKALWNEALEFAVKNAQTTTCGHSPTECCVKSESILTHKYPE